MYGRMILFCGIIYLVGILASNIAQARIDDGVILEDNVVEQFQPPHENYEYSTPPCCTKPSIDDAHYVVVSTMDGKVEALDILDQGRTVWRANIEEEPLMGGTLGQIPPMETDGNLFRLVPALDGSLYMYSNEQRLLEPIPLNADMLLQASVRIGQDAVAGGKTVSTTGIDPLSGEVRYHCTTAHCEKSKNELVSSTLVLRRSTNTVRAVDALTGTERWNLSVSEYDASLVVANPNEVDANYKQRYRFSIHPPDGIVSAYDSCGNHVWTRQIGSHIAKTWKIEGGQLAEVSFFENSFNNNPDSLFYLGTLNAEPFIIHSSKVKNELRRFARNLESDENHSIGSQMLQTNSHVYRIQPNSLDDILTETFKSSFAGRQKRDSNRLAITERGDQELQVVSGPSHSSGDSNSCQSGHQVSIIGEKDILSAHSQLETRVDTGSNRIRSEIMEETNETMCSVNTSGDQGWFVMQPTGASKKKNFLGFMGGDQCSMFVDKMSKTLRVNQNVSGWWRIAALSLFSVLGAVSVVGYGFYKRRKRRILAAANEARILLATQTSLSSEGSKKTAKTQSTSISLGNLSSKTPDSPPEEVINRSRRTTSSQNSMSEPFQSKFLLDFEPVNLLGHGGFGVVFEAINRLDECPYAVKRIAVENNEKAINRVLREVRAMAKLDHVGITRYYHTWIERPPDGWQKETDNAILKNMKAIKKIRAMREDLVSKTESKHPAIKSSDISSNSLIAPPIRDEKSEDVSWCDSENNCERSNVSSSDDQSVGIMMPSKPHVENSVSIVFGEQSTSEKESSDAIPQIGEQMVLVTSIDEDLLPCSNTSNVVYLYIQIQLCQDITLHEWLSTHNEKEDRPLEKMKTWMAQLCSATEYIHEQGLIHRDIKPQNIFFAPDQYLKIGDLGLVTKCVSPDDNSVKTSSKPSYIHTGNVGTRSYMSPEQLKNLHYTSKVDVFSLGLVYCELVYPFRTVIEKSKTLLGLQNGIKPEVLKSMPDEYDFVSWLTSINPEDRPTCDDILSSDYLAEGTQALYRRRSMSTRRSQRLDRLSD